MNNFKIYLKQKKTKLQNRNNYSILPRAFRAILNNFFDNNFQHDNKKRQKVVLKNGIRLSKEYGEEALLSNIA